MSPNHADAKSYAYLVRTGAIHGVERRESSSVGFLM